MRRSQLTFGPKGSRFGQKRVLNTIRPIEVFRTLQLGAYPAPAITKRFLEVHFAMELLEKNITPTKLQALENSSCNALLRQLFQSKFLSVPCRIITFDAEFTGLPTFTNEGPTEDIIELGAYCPVRGKVFSRLVKTEKTIPEAVVNLTGITNEQLEAEGVPFESAWTDFVHFIEADWQAEQTVPALEASSSLDSSSSQADSKKVKKSEGEAKAGKKDERDSGKKADKKDKPKLSTEQINAQGEQSIWYDPVDIRRIPSGLVSMEEADTAAGVPFKPKVLLLSHGGKLADIAMIEWALKKSNMTLPAWYKFGDTNNIIQDLHQRRPVTQDKHPPSYKLNEMCGWLKSPVPKTIHRAGPDAAMTWSAVFHTLDRYGDESRTPHQQLVLRYFEQDAVQLMSEVDGPNSREAITADDSRSDMSVGTPATEDDMSILDLDLDDILK